MVDHQIRQNFYCLSLPFVGLLLYNIDRISGLPSTLEALLVCDAAHNPSMGAADNPIWSGLFF